MSTQGTVAVRNAVEAACADVADGALVLVACSGGPDSLALAACTAWVGKRRGFRTGAVIVDHGLQEFSAEIAEQAALACGALGLDPVSVERVHVGSAGGPEAAARDARYAALSAAADALGAAAVLLGHTREDQAETVLLRLARGSGARSLAAMAPANGLWRRPMLDLPRAVVHECAAEECERIGMSPWNDPHNVDPAYSRVRVREALPLLAETLGEGVISGLSRSARLLRDDADALDAWAAVEIATHVSTNGQGCSIDVAALESMPRAIRTRIYKVMCERCGATELDAAHIAGIDELVTRWHGQGILNLPGRVNAAREYGRLSVWPPTME
ncbi:MAG: tRNA lysidine(34) synthetase TilS [Candidatus Nanopelagicales bacterium]